VERGAAFTWRVGAEKHEIFSRHGNLMMAGSGQLRFLG
jgi:hypothetical protein